MATLGQLRRVQKGSFVEIVHDERPTIAHIMALDPSTGYAERFGLRIRRDGATPTTIIASFSRDEFQGRLIRTIEIDEIIDQLNRVNT